MAKIDIRRIRAEAVSRFTPGDRLVLVEDDTTLTVVSNWIYWHAFGWGALWGFLMGAVVMLWF